MGIVVVVVVLGLCVLFDYFCFWGVVCLYSCL